MTTECATQCDTTADNQSGESNEVCQASPTPQFRPNVDIVERDDAVVIVADLPGASRDGIGIEFEAGELAIHAKVEQRRSPSAAKLHTEYGVGDFRRTFIVSEAIDDANITADYVDGVLTVRLPKTPEVQPRKIAVQAGKN